MRIFHTSEKRARSLMGEKHKFHLEKHIFLLLRDKIEDFRHTQYNTWAKLRKIIYCRNGGKYQNFSRKKYEKWGKKSHRGWAGYMCSIANMCRGFPTNLMRPLCNWLLCELSLRTGNFLKNFFAFSFLTKHDTIIIDGNFELLQLIMKYCLFIDVNKSYQINKSICSDVEGIFRQRLFASSSLQSGPSKCDDVTFISM